MAEVVVSGSLFDIGIALQSAKGVVVPDSGVQYRFPVTGGGLSAAQVINPIVETASGRVRNTNYIGGINVDGAPALAARLPVLGLLLYLLFGSKTVTGAADPWQHVFTFGASQPYFTAWKRMGDLVGGGYYEKYRDCKVVGLTLASSAEGILIATPTIMGLRVTNSALPATAVAIDNSAIVLAHHHGDGAMLVEGVNVGSISTISFNFGGDADRVRGNSLYGMEIAEKMRNLVIDATTLVDWALLKRVLYGTATPADGATPAQVIMELAAPGIDFKYLVPGQPQERSLRIQAARVQTAIDVINPNTDGTELTMVAHHNILQPTDGSSAVTATLKNGIASYPVAA